MNVGIVVIGRNEGARLARCLESLRQIGCPTVYVDSGSSDRSVAVAAALGIETVALPNDQQLSAARARNEGFARLLAKHPHVHFVQFLDGDSTLLPGWIEAGRRELSQDPRRAAVVGHVLERDPAGSAYNRLCAMEWRSAPGEVKNYGLLGGISMMRADVFRSLGGFRPDVIAGEEPELGVRMALAGYKVVKIDRPMAVHDASLSSFRQWWRRAVRGGHAIGQRSDIHGRSALKDCVRERYSTLFWGIGLPLLILLAALPTRGASFILLAAYLVLGFRIWRFRRSMGEGMADAALYAVFIVVAKFANGVGLVKYFLRRLSGRYVIIEYK